MTSSPAGSTSSSHHGGAWWGLAVNQKVQAHHFQPHVWPTQREAVDLLRGAAKRCTAEAERLEQDPDARAAAVGDTVSATNAEVG